MAGSGAHRQRCDEHLGRCRRATGDWRQITDFGDLGRPSSRAAFRGRLTAASSWPPSAKGDSDIVLLEGCSSGAPGNR